MVDYEVLEHDRTCDGCYDDLARGTRVTVLSFGGRPSAVFCDGCNDVLADPGRLRPESRSHTCSECEGTTSPGALVQVFEFPSGRTLTVCEDCFDRAAARRAVEPDPDLGETQEERDAMALQRWEEFRARRRDPGFQMPRNRRGRT
jgi:hypothetical protein